MQYKKLTGIILKKQNYREADQIITIWTAESGKIRGLAKGIRLSKSKLLHSLQDLALVNVEITGKNLPVIINARCIRQFSTLSEDLQKTAIAFYAAELMLKMTADEHPNTVAFDLLKEFLVCLDHLDYSIRYYPLLECFSLKLLQSLGFSVPRELSSDLQELKELEFARFDQVNMETDRVEKLHRMINKFIEYVLERNIKSELFMNHVTYNT